MPRYRIEDRDKHMFRTEENQRKNLYYILTEIGVRPEFLWKHAQYFDDATEMERRKRRDQIQEKINTIEAKGGKTNYQDMYEMYGKVWDLWSIITQIQTLPEDFIEANIHRFSNEWRTICERQKLSDDFMRRHADKMNWWAVAYFQDYSEEFLLEFFDEIYEAVKHDRPRHTPNNGFLRVKSPTNPQLILLLKMRGMME
jgi:hypothetical protein